MSREQQFADGVTVEPRTWYRHTTQAADAVLAEHGLCARTEYGGDPVEPGTFPWRTRQTQQDEPGAQWHLREIADGLRPVAIDGLTDSEVTAAREVLADTVRAAAVFTRLVRRRREHAERRIIEAFAVEARALATRAERGVARGRLDADYTTARDRTNALLVQAAVDEDLTDAVIERSGVEPRDRARQARQQAIERLDQAHLEGWPDPRTPLYLSLADVADRIGVGAATVRGYRSRGDADFPGEDITIGGTPGWTWHSIEAWMQRRARSARPR